VLIVVMGLLSYDLITSGNKKVEKIPEAIVEPINEVEDKLDTGEELIVEPAPEIDEAERFPEPTETTEEAIEIEEPELPEEVPPEEPDPELEEPGDTEVTYFFFHADYCATCQTMKPWIKELDVEHPKLNVELVDLHSGSSYISKFAVRTTTVSVILRKEDGEEVSGTKISGFMDKDAIERFICTELDDEICDNI